MSDNELIVRVPQSVIIELLSEFLKESYIEHNYLSENNEFLLNNIFVDEEEEEFVFTVEIKEGILH